MGEELMSLSTVEPILQRENASIDYATQQIAWHEQQIAWNKSQIAAWKDSIKESKKYIAEVKEQNERHAQTPQNPSHQGRRKSRCSA